MKSFLVRLPRNWFKGWRPTVCCTPITHINSLKTSTRHEMNQFTTPVEALGPTAFWTPHHFLVWSCSIMGPLLFKILQRWAGSKCCRDQLHSFSIPSESRELNHTSWKKNSAYGALGTRLHNAQWHSNHTRAGVGSQSNKSVWGSAGEEVNNALFLFLCMLGSE